jgi:hypothetical protein
MTGSEPLVAANSTGGGRAPHRNFFGCHTRSTVVPKLRMTTSGCLDEERKPVVAVKYQDGADRCLGVG